MVQLSYMYRIKLHVDQVSYKHRIKLYVDQTIDGPGELQA